MKLFVNFNHIHFLSLLVGNDQVSCLPVIATKHSLFVGSQDDKAVEKFLWEIVKGPITDQQEYKEGAMFKLRNLSPGNYSVRLTVSDAEGLTNSTLATVLVEQVWRTSGVVIVVSLGIILYYMMV